MIRSTAIMAALVLSLSTASFGAEAPKKDQHGSKSAKPGSYEDWCGEHGVPESMDTRCDKSLIPAFKATGDWCDKHGLPKSQDKKCNPNLKIVRPPKGSK
jgi:hypothetical protein